MCREGGNAVALVLLFGLPAAGKSTLAREIASHFSSRTTSHDSLPRDVHVTVIENDSYLFHEEKGGEQVTPLPNEENSEAVWFSPELHHKATKLFTEKVVETLQQCQEQHQKSTDSCRANPSQVVSLVLAVDVFHWTGMRLSWWKIVRDMNTQLLGRRMRDDNVVELPCVNVMPFISFGLVLVAATKEGDDSVDDAAVLLRNSLRTGKERVPQHVMDRLCCTFEGGTIPRSNVPFWRYPNCAQQNQCCTLDAAFLDYLVGPCCQYCPMQPPLTTSSLITTSPAHEFDSRLRHAVKKLIEEQRDPKRKEEIAKITMKNKSLLLKKFHSHSASLSSLPDVDLLVLLMEKKLDCSHF